MLNEPTEIYTFAFPAFLLHGDMLGPRDKNYNPAAIEIFYFFSREISFFCPCAKWKSMQLQNDGSARIVPAHLQAFSQRQKALWHFTRRKIAQVKSEVRTLKEMKFVKSLSQRPNLIS